MSESRTPAIQIASEARQALLAAIKRAGWATISQLAAGLSVSTEAVRQQVWQLEKDGWLTSDCGPEGEEEARLRGRPAASYCLTKDGDDLFLKNYADVAVQLFDGLGDPSERLASLTDQRVRSLEPALKGRSMREQADALRSVYVAGD